jgi:hypothetical protein
MNIDEKLCACFVDLQKVFGRVNWTKLMTIIKGPGKNLLKNLDQKQLENVEYFKYMKSSIKNNARGTREVQFRISMTKAAFDKKLDLNWRKRLHLDHSFGCY